MKIAVVGAGQWGKNLVRVGCELVGTSGVSVVDVDPDRLRAVSAAHPGVRVNLHVKSVLNDPAVKAVLLATPAVTHAPMAKEFLQAGKHVFVEKPLALSRAQAEELVDLAESRGLVLMVGHLLLYQPGVRWIREFLHSGGVGEVWSFHQERLNLGTVRTVENALWSLGVHDVAVLLYLVGRSPVRVQAVGQTALQPAVEDDVYIHIDFPAGVQAHIHVSWLWPEKRRQLMIIGSEAMMCYDELSQRVVLHRKSVGHDMRPFDGGSEVVFQDSSSDLLRAEIEEFLAAVRERRRPLTDGRSAIDVVTVLEEASRQLAVGRRV